MNVTMRERLVADLPGVWAGPDVVLAPHIPHRTMQHLAEAASYWLLLAGAEAEGADLARRRIIEALTALAEQQDDATGLFVVGDNVLSPPDSSFTINGLGRLALVLRAADATGPHWDDVAARIRGILAAVAGALRSGGVHTPNHRWEIASALTRSWAVLGDDTLRDRAEQWLAEGLDVQADGLYSERSPNYAVHVSNPSLTVMAQLLARPGFLEIVHRNLHVHSILTGADGNVCTLQSRRQDQGHDFPLAAFEPGYRVAAHAFGCAECLAMAERGAALGGGDPVELAADLLSGHIDDQPAGSAPPLPGGWTDLDASELAVHRAGDGMLVVRAASDVAAVGRVCSGTNHEPSMVAYAAGALRVAGARLSRRFFGLGPFRASSIERDGDTVTLRETATAGYYQPLPPDRHSANGVYPLEFEGRFAARMAFSERSSNDLSLDTRIDVTRLADGLRMSIATSGPAVPLCLELALGAAPVAVDGAVEIVEPGLWEVRGDAFLTVADEQWVLEPSVADLVGDGFYEPGEEVRYMAGSDASAGPRIRLAWRSGQALDVRLRRLDA